MARQGQKLTDELKEQIRAHLVVSGNVKETARTFKVSDSTVMKIRDENKDDFEQLRADKKKEMIERVWSDMEEALDLGRQKIKLAKVAINEFQPTLDRLIELLEDNEQTNGKDVIDLIKALSSITSIPLSHISTYFGTLYDKRALMLGDPTQNIGMSGHLGIDVERMSDDELLSGIEAAVRGIADLQTRIGAKGET